MASPTRTALKNLRSGVDVEAAMEDLAGLGETAVRELTRELEMQSQHSLFTGTLLVTLGKIAAVNERWFKARTLSVIFNVSQRFIPPGVVANDDRNSWIVTNLHSLGVQLLRSRYRLDDKAIHAAEASIRRANKGTRHEGAALADVLDGDLDGNPELKADYVAQILGFLDNAVANSDTSLAVTTARIAGCFGSLAGGAVPSIVQLLQWEAAEEDGDMERVYWLLETLERIGHPAGTAIPTILDLLNMETESLIREDGLMIRIMDALGGIGLASDEVRKLLMRGRNNTAAIIQTRANNTLWKLCIEPDA